MVTNLRLARVRTGLRLRDFARRHSLSEARLSRWETGKEYIPPAWRQVLAKTLGVTEQAICDERGWPILVEPETGGADSEATG